MRLLVLLYPGNDMKFVSHILIIICFVSVNCGSVRHNIHLQEMSDKYEAKWRKEQRSHIEWMIKEAECRMIADSLQIVIWGLESDMDSLQYQLRHYRFTQRREKGW